MVFRYPPESSENSEDTRRAKVATRLREGEIKHRLQEIGLSFEPKIKVALAVEDAIREYNDWQIFGLPYAGGTRQQPHEWVAKMRCVVAAKHLSDDEIDRKREEEAESERASQQNQQTG